MFQELAKKQGKLENQYIDSIKDALIIVFEL